MICWFGSLGADNKRRLEKSVKCSQNTVGTELNDIFVRLEPLGGKRPVCPDPQNSLHASCKASLLAAGEGRGFGSSCHFRSLLCIFKKTNNKCRFYMCNVNLRFFFFSFLTSSNVFMCFFSLNHNICGFS